ncbi:hypothetical protein A3P64_07225 [Lactobacillus johnsonii]|uniref:DUF3021 domain-containing protein n=1 Tax=Lactobacillus johnsonii TaxID=33959 RepID=A0AAX0PTL9_LACJH|nr:MULTISPECIES: DUF3021 domain-containing protein [Lactobacillus]ARW75238.1 hypothetical protein A3P31_06660 [Lactobacillus johnsonii]ARW76803.1 hypothetical protein A3P32_05885 [Lactobacillus johnsonii]MCL5443997.1 DUF3021 domain-containing protein [Lactobacillus johnsonii]PAB45024.1 hypothetical protein A3P60_07710 [Lactobacillus johnsonii]PAB52268.1 hypothetical protein A3P64_07225 [Lactobacillus johnsonii]
MKIWRKILDYFVTGIGFGAITYLLILGMLSDSVGDVDVPLKSVLIVFICSGLIGELSFLFQTDLSYLLALGLHLVGTFILFSIMMILNHWIINWQTLMIFILSYIVIWIIIRLTQERDIRKINQQIKKRSRR